MKKLMQDLIIEEDLNFEKLDQFLKEPNYLEILGVSTKELQHSNFLAWFLNSTTSHNTGSFFLKNFINLLSIRSENKIKINLSNLENTEILREFNNIDILIVNKDLKFTICIENKINAGKTGENQLLKYYEIVETIWSDEEHKNYYVYLTPHPRELTEKEVNVGYENITYLSIIEILENTIKSKKPSYETMPLIKNYLTNLKKNIMGQSEEIILAQNIYRKHKSAIDFIIESKPNLSNLFDSINKHFKEHSKYKNLTPDDKRIIRILPKEILDFFELKTFSWGEIDKIFTLEIFCEQEEIWMKFCFGGIWVEDEKIKEDFQLKKDKLFKKMKAMKSIQSGIVTGSKSSSRYPAVAKFTIMKIDDEIIFKENSLFDAFVTKFKELEKNIINKWTNEIKDNFKKVKDI